MLSVLLLLTVITGMIGCRKDGDGTITTVTPGTSLSTSDTTAPGTDEPTGTSDAATSAPGADGTAGTSPDTSAPDTSAPDSTTDTPASKRRDDDRKTGQHHLALHIRHNNCN